LYEFGFSMILNKEYMYKPSFIVKDYCFSMLEPPRVALQHNDTF